MSDYRDNLGDLRSIVKVYDQIRDDEEKVVVQEGYRLTRLIWTYRDNLSHENIKVSEVKHRIAEIIGYSVTTLDEFCKNRRRLPDDARIKLREYLEQKRLLHLADNPYADSADKIKTIEKSRKKRLKRGEKSDHPFFDQSPILSEDECIELDEFWADNDICTVVNLVGDSELD